MASVNTLACLNNRENKLNYLTLQAIPLLALATPMPGALQLSEMFKATESCCAQGYKLLAKNLYIELFEKPTKGPEAPYLGDKGEGIKGKFPPCCFAQTLRDNSYETASVIKDSKLIQFTD